MILAGPTENGHLLTFGFRVLVVLLIYALTARLHTLAAEARWRVLLAFLIGFPLGLWLVSYVWINVFLHRLLLPIVPLVIIVILALLDGRAHRRRFALLLLLPVLALLFANYSSGRANLAAPMETCAGSDHIFANTTASGIIAMYYGEHMPILRLNPDDQGQTISDSAKAALGWAQADIATLSGDVCVVNYSMGDPAAEAYFAGIIARYPVTASVDERSHADYPFNVYRVRVP
jgi:hypothetical protein